MTNSEQAIREFAENLASYCSTLAFMTEGDVKQLADSFHKPLTALISEHYVAKAAYIALENTLAKAEAKNLELLRQRDELREALIDMVWQFAYRSTFEGREHIYSGGLSSLEDAFSVLSISDPITVMDFEAAIKSTER